MDSLVNGVAADSIFIDDRGLAYGDGVFETIAVRAGEALLFEAHMRRLRHGCLQLCIPAPDSELCRGEVVRLCGGRTGVIKLIVTRGRATRGYAPQGAAQPNRLLLFSKWEGYPLSFYTQGVRLAICRTRLSTQERLAGIKHLNRLENVLAASELDREHSQEGIMLDHDNRVIECTRSNIFFIKGGEIHTPALHRCGIEGVMRDHVLRCAGKHGVRVHVRDIRLEEAERMDEAFISNSLIGVWPVTLLDDRISFRLNMVSTIRGWITEHTLGATNA